MADGHYPSVSPFRAGLACRCPRCGQGRLYSGFLEVARRCAVCDLDLSAQDSGDGPAVFIILILGFIVVGLALGTEIVFAPPFWVHALLWPPVILGGIYLGVFTPTESAGIGVLVALILGLALYRKIGVRDLPPLVEKAARTTCMILMIIAAATVFSHLVTLMRVPQSIASYVAEAGVTELQFWAVIVALCIVLGCFLEAAAILYLVVPVVSPVLPVLGIEHAQFAVVLVILIELGMITPPLGLNLFVIQGLQPKATLTDVAAGSLPFMLLMLAGAAVVIAWPQLSLALPNYLGS